MKKIGFILSLVTVLGLALIAIQFLSGEIYAVKDLGVEVTGGYVLWPHVYEADGSRVYEWGITQEFTEMPKGLLGPKYDVHYTIVFSTSEQLPKNRFGQAQLDYDTTVAVDAVLKSQISLAYRDRVKAEENVKAAVAGILLKKGFILTGVRVVSP